MRVAGAMPLDAFPLSSGHAKTQLPPGNLSKN